MPVHVYSEDILLMLALLVRCVRLARQHQPPPPYTAPSACAMPQLPRPALHPPITRANAQVVLTPNVGLEEVAASKVPLRAGYMGHVTQIASTLESLAAGAVDGSDEEPSANKVRRVVRSNVYVCGPCTHIRVCRGHILPLCSSCFAAV